MALTGLFWTWSWMTRTQTRHEPNVSCKDAPPIAPVYGHRARDYAQVYATHEMLCLVYTPSAGSCYKELCTGTRAISPMDDVGIIRWNMAALPSGTHRVSLARRMTKPYRDDWEVINTEDELRGKSTGLRSTPTLYGCTIHVKPGSHVFPSIHKRHVSQPFGGVDFYLKRPGEV